MPTATQVSTDLYAVLGVDRSAPGDEIARAFRARAKQLHPDTSVEADASAKFNELVTAYGILSNHRTRREYDARRSEQTALEATANASGRAATASNAKPRQWTRRRAWTALVGGLLTTVLGIGAAAFTWHLHESDAQQRARYRPVTAVRATNGDITFLTADGQAVETREPQQHGDGSGDSGVAVKVRYDPANPTHVILDATNTGRDITLAIVSLKLVIGGPVFVVLGAVSLKRRRRRSAGPTAAR